MRFRHVLLFAAAAVVLAILPGPAVGASWKVELKSDVVTGIGPIKRVNRRQVTLGDFTRKLGNPSTLRRGKAACRAQWKRHGLSATFTSFGDSDRSCGGRSGKALQAFAVGGPHSTKWLIGKGAKIGDSRTRFDEVYPDAYFENVYGMPSWIFAESYTGYGEDGYTPTAWAQFDPVTVKLNRFEFWVGGAGD